MSWLKHLLGVLPLKSITMAQRQFKIGTRTSLLAWRQSEMMRDLIQKHHPLAQVALHGIQTRGDQIQDRPLTELEGKDFFVAELDKALIAGETDLTVHSLKDLSTERPAELYLAAIPPRYTPHDVLIFAPDTFLVADCLAVLSSVPVHRDASHVLNIIFPLSCLRLVRKLKSPARPFEGM